PAGMVAAKAPRVVRHVRRVELAGGHVLDGGCKGTAVAVRGKARVDRVHVTVVGRVPVMVPRHRLFPGQVDVAGPLGDVGDADRTGAVSDPGELLHVADPGRG